MYEIIVSIKVKNNLRLLASRYLSNSEYMNIYRSYRNKLLNKLINKKMFYYRNVLNVSKNNSRSLWGPTRTVAGDGLREYKIIKAINNDNDELISEQFNIVQYFNNYFSEIENKLAR